MFRAPELLPSAPDILARRAPEIPPIFREAPESADVSSCCRSSERAGKNVRPVRQSSIILKNRSADKIIKDLLAVLVEEEKKHKLGLETEYDTNVMKEN